MLQELLPGIKLFDLTGKAAVITGGSKGLGFAMAAGLASAGADVILVNRNAAEGEKSATELSGAFGTRVISYAADITSMRQTEDMARFAMETFGKIDILINSAGINIRGPIDQLAYEDFTKVMEVNVNGTWLASRAVIPYMKKERQRADHQPGQYPWAGWSCGQNPLHGQQRCRSAIDPGTRTGTCTF